MNTTKRSKRGDEQRSPNLKCPSCIMNTQHTSETWKKYHPLAGTGNQADTNYIKPKA